MIQRGRAGKGLGAHFNKPLDVPCGETRGQLGKASTVMQSLSFLSCQEGVERFSQSTSTSPYALCPHPSSG